MGKKSEDRRQRIIDVATQMFLAQGFERTSMSKIAAMTGGSKGTLYSYFSSKEELFVEAIHHHTIFSKHRTLPALDSQRDLTEMLADLGKGFLRMKYQSNTIQTYRHIYAEACMNGVGQIFHENGPQPRLTATADYLATKMAEGALRSANPMIVAQQLYALFEAELELPVLLDVRTPPEEAEIEEVVARALDVFMRAYGT